MFVLLLSTFSSAEIYKYKDKNGKWVYTDKKPKASVQAETITTRQQALPSGRIQGPKITLLHQGNEFIIVGQNHLPIAVEVAMKGELGGVGQYVAVIPAEQKKELLRSRQPIGEFQYRWLIGDPKARPDSFQYRFPVDSKQAHLISQGFNGRFSHHSRPSRHAVDIAMQVGTYIAAARGGRVVKVSDDYVMGGAQKYFLDKANSIVIAHKDGSYALYAHLLQGTALVKVGDEVVIGQRLARSGSSGYSTGPHLHFVIQRNTGMRTVSIPFRFRREGQAPFTPRRGMRIKSHD